MDLFTIQYLKNLNDSELIKAVHTYIAFVLKYQDLNY